MVKVNISLSQKILDEIDKVRKEHNVTRSELLRKAFQTYVDVLEENRKEIEKRKGIEKAIKQQDEIRKEIGSMDLIADLRNWRDRRK
jgi:metal-responsive CopG/Arc/MetJ family transcriptional regulator